MTAQPDAVAADLEGPIEGTTAGSSVVLAARDLRKRYGELEAVKGVSFQIHEGETYGLLGPNGAGKTTTISMVCGLLTPGRRRGDPGRSRRSTWARWPRRRGIGYVAQELAIYPDLSARGNLEFFGRLYDLGGAQLKVRVERGAGAHRPDRAGPGTGPPRSAAACSAGSTSASGC